MREAKASGGLAKGSDMAIRNVIVQPEGCVPHSDLEIKIQDLLSVGFRGSVAKKGSQI